MLAPNTVLHNRYLVVRQLGQGGMGAVYMATDQTFGSTVALKETLIADELLRKAFEREARLLNSLHHASLPHVFDYFFEGAGQFLVMQYIPGEDLGQQLKRHHRPFPSDLVLKWMDQLLDLLDYLHGHEPPIIHRDIKPENLKTTQRGDIILLDFGLAKGAVDQMTQASSKSLFGYTPHYAPFEQIRGTGTDPRSDLYSLAATFFHLLAGTLPPDSLTRAECVLNGEPDPLTNVPALLPMVTPAVANVLQRALAQKRDYRHPSAAAMRADLREAMKSIPSTVKVPSPLQPHVPTLVEGTAHIPPTSSPFPQPPPPPTIPSHPSNPQPTAPLFPSNPQQAPPYQSIPPAPVYPPFQPAPSPTPSFPPTPATVHSAHPTPSHVPAKSNGAKVVVALAVVAVVLVAIAAVAAILLVPGILDGGNKNGNQVVNTNAANTNRPVDAKATAKTLTPLGMLNAPNTVLAVAMAADGKYVASSAEENAIRLWQSSNSTLVRELSGQTKPSRGLDCSPDGLYVASGCDDGTVRIWKAADGTEVRSFKAHDEYVFILAYSPDGSKLVTASGDKTVKVWRAADGGLVKTVNGPRGDYNIVNVSPDLEYVAYYGADKGVTVWSISLDKEVSSLENHSYDLRAGDFSPDGRLLALGGTDGVVRVWNTSDGSLVREMKTSGTSIHRLRFSPDGALLVSGSADGSIRLWKASDGTKFHEVVGHKSPVNSIAFSGDGTTLVTGSSDKTVQVWSVRDK